MAYSIEIFEQVIKTFPNKKYNFKTLINFARLAQGPDKKCLKQLLINFGFKKFLLKLKHLLN